MVVARQTLFAGPGRPLRVEAVVNRAAGSGQVAVVADVTERRHVGALVVRESKGDRARRARQPGRTVIRAAGRPSPARRRDPAIVSEPYVAARVRSSDAGIRASGTSLHRGTNRPKPPAAPVSGSRQTRLISRRTGAARRPAARAARSEQASARVS